MFSTNLISDVTVTTLMNRKGMNKMENAKNEALTVQKLLFAATKMEETLNKLGLSEDEKNQVGTYFFALRLEIDGQFTPPPTITGSLPEGFVPPKPTYEDLERSLKSAEKKWLLALSEVGNMKRYWAYQ